MFDPIFKALAWLLSFFYAFSHNYAIAIALLTLTVMLLLFPLNAKGMRSMAAMSKLSPEMKRIQAKYKNDKVKQNEEVMALFKEHKVTPFGGCLPLLLQMPVLFIMYRVIRGMVQIATKDVRVGDLLIRKGTFNPKYLDHGSELYKSLAGGTHMRSFGLDLAKSASEVLKISFVTAIPFLVLIAGVVAAGYFQQAMISRRNPNQNTDDNPMAKQMQQMTKVMPLMYLVFGFTLPAGLNVYFLVSSLFRIGQQTLIYKLDPTLSPGHGSRTLESRDVTEKSTSGSASTSTSTKAVKAPPAPKASTNGAKVKPATANGAAAPSAPPARIANRPAKKKKRR
jgi:YidC/Oxa1 family membrane protein insertase